MSFKSKNRYTLIFFQPKAVFMFDWCQSPCLNLKKMDKNDTKEKFHTILAKEMVV